MWFINFKHSKTELPGLSKFYVWMATEKDMNAKMMKVTHSLSKYLWKLCSHSEIYSSTLVYGGDISSFHLINLKHNTPYMYFHSSFL